MKFKPVEPACAANRRHAALADTFVIGRNMEQIGKRIRIDGSEIRISSPKNIFMLLFMPIWLCGWTIGGFTTISQVISMPANEAWFLLFWLCGWVFGEIFVLYGDIVNSW
jgi:hypothetical protein